MRSWVIGRGVSIPWRAKAMAVASGAPMKIGSVRPRPSDSWSRRTGVFDCRSTRTARSRTSTMVQTYSPRRARIASGDRAPPATVGTADPLFSAVEQVPSA